MAGHTNRDVAREPEMAKLRVTTSSTAGSDRSACAGIRTRTARLVAVPLPATTRAMRDICTSLIAYARTTPPAGATDRRRVTRLAPCAPSTAATAGLAAGGGHKPIALSGRFDSRRCSISTADKRGNDSPLDSATYSRPSRSACGLATRFPDGQQWSAVAGSGAPIALSTCASSAASESRATRGRTTRTLSSGSSLLRITWMAVLS